MHQPTLELAATISDIKCHLGPVAYIRQIGLKGLANKYILCGKAVMMLSQYLRFDISRGAIVRRSWSKENTGRVSGNGSVRPCQFISSCCWLAVKELIY